MSAPKRVNLPIGNPEVENLLLWRDPKKSGIVFAAITAAYLLLEWSNFSLLSVTCNVLLAAVGICFAWNNIASFTNKPGVPVPYWLKEGISENQVRSFAQRLTGPINKTLGFAHRLAVGKDVMLSLQVAACLFVVGKFGNYFTTCGLLYTVAVLAFTLPKVYELKKDEIDSVLNKLRHETKKHYSKHVEPLVNKIPRASNSGASANRNPADAVKDTARSAANEARSAANDARNAANQARSAANGVDKKFQ